MARYILIDHYSGFIFADSADLEGHIFAGTPIAFAVAFDLSINERGRVYEEVSRSQLAANDTAYHIYRADVGGSEQVGPIWDGQAQELIDAVERDCRYETTIRVTREGEQ